MYLFKRSIILSCVVSAYALVLAINAGADSFTIVNGQTVTTTQTLSTTGNIGTVENGGVIDVTNGNGIEGTANGVTVNNAGSVTSGDARGISVLGESTVTNTGTTTGGLYGIAANGTGNTITNSGWATGGRNGSGIAAFGNGNTITNSGTATSGFVGIYAKGDNNTITNSGTATGGDCGIAALGNDSTITNSGTAGGGFGIFAIGDNNTITNSGTATSELTGIYAKGSNNTITNSGKTIGGEASVYFDGSNNTLTLLSGSNVQGMLDIAGTGGNTLVIGRRLSTALTYLGGEGVILDTSGMPFVSSGGVLAVIDPTLFSAEGDMLNDLTRSLADLVDARLGSARSGYGAANMVAAAPTGIVPTADVPDAVEPQSVIWAAGIGNYRSQDSNGIYEGFDSTLGGFAIGADGVMSSGTRLGGFAGASFASLNTDAGTQEIDADSYYAGLYAGFTMSEAFLNLALTGGYTSQSTSRDVLNNLVAGGVENAKGDPNGIFISPLATIGTDIDTGGIILTPSLRARYAGLFMDSYDENGSTADLSVDSRSVNLFDLRGQVAFAIAPMQTNGGHFDAALRLGTDATYANSEDVSATLLGQSLNFNVSDNDTTVRGFAGLDLAYETNSGANFTLTGEAGYDTSDALTLTGTAGIAWAF
ncbi:autotransporter domain-containing protein [Aestuariivirga sp.]|uniref:autotransporter outer membrane beta-barrel domain-containing protein n=1 Tax=Aestuariivirga sp. TaxID=2650926 RepID=UPI003784C780